MLDPATSSTTDTPRRKHIILREGTDLEAIINPASVKIAKEVNSVKFQLQNLPPSQIWPLGYGALISGICATATGFYFTKVLRKGLVLQNLGMMSTYLFCSGVAGMTTAIGHRLLVTAPLIEDGFQTCPVCFQMRSAVFQVVSGAVYPAILAPVTLLGIIRRLTKSYRLPNITKDPMGLVRYFVELLQPARRYAVPILGFHMALGMGLAYLQQETILANTVPVLPKHHSDGLDNS